MTGTVPLDTRRLRRVAGTLGSNPAGVYEDEAGRRYYVKTLESAAHARNERLAAALYRLAGAPTLDYVPTVAPEQVATVWQHLVKRHVSQLDENERRQARHWFGVHAWTANWDAAGFDGDNQGVTEDGRVLTLDVGGALEFRAQGDPKGRAFGTTVPELHTLRNDPDNPHARALFGPLRGEELRRAVEVVTTLHAARMAAVVAEGGGRPALADRLLARQEDLARWLATSASSSG